MENKDYRTLKNNLCKNEYKVDGDRYAQVRLNQSYWKFCAMTIVKVVM